MQRNKDDLEADKNNTAKIPGLKLDDFAPGWLCRPAEVHDSLIGPMAE